MMTYIKYDIISNITVRPELTCSDINNKWIFGNTKHVINVSTRINENVKQAVLAKGATYDWFPLHEEPTMESTNIIRAVKAIYQYLQEGSPIIVHCIGGNNRSRTVVELLYFILTMRQIDDEYKGFQNHLLYNCENGYLITLTQLKRLFEIQN